MAWNKITKATGTGWTKIAKPIPSQNATINPGTPIGLLLALTYSTGNAIIGTAWSKINKSTSASWSKITKSTGTSWNKTNKATGTSWNKITKAT